MREYERKQLLERVEREGATVGAAIPERIDVEGEDPLALRAFVHGVQNLDGEADPGEVAAVKKRLRRERLRRRNRIDEGDISRREGERLADEIVGIDRALNALQNLGSDPAEEARTRETVDQQRWLSFLRRALGEDEGGERGQTGRGGLGGGP
ncbi:MAG: DUF5788 family protein [Halobacteriaceae archaeon]